MDTEQRSYATRIRHNILIKPTIRLRNAEQTDTQRKNKQSSQGLPPFPPPHIVLHPDDASNKAFLAIARAFLSVDNRAMTIKDLAERASKYGLVCQNLSAAAQAITTYLRAHKARCDKQQDQALLLSHTLSGTPADDDLVPALYSRSGGDSHPTENRLTNFRKGTAVWYLSRATGVSCPFARAGIRLCDYVVPEDGGSSRREKSTPSEREALCGQKRKRPLRGCVAQPSGSDDERPPKVKLTLRLKPLLKPTTTTNNEPSTSTIPSNDDSESDESGDESMSVDDSSDDESQTAQLKKDQDEHWCLPPYPRRSISIPSYTPSLETHFPRLPSPAQYYKDPFRCSPSLQYATPPPDSEDEVDDFHITMTRIKNFPDYHSRNDEMGWDADLDSEGDGETMWESPGPRSPSAPLAMAPAEVTVKEEPHDLQGMLDAWDDYDAGARVAEVIAKATATVLEAEAQVKVEALDRWVWEPENPAWNSEETTRVKQEDDVSANSLFPPAPNTSPISSLSSQFASFSHSDSASPGQTADVETPELEDDSQAYDNYSTVRPRAKTVPAPSIFYQSPAPTSMTSFSAPPTLPRQSFSASSKPPSREPSVPSTALVTLLQSMSVNTTVFTNNANSSTFNLPPPSPCVSPSQTRCQPTSVPLSPQPKVVVHTCQPCDPSISATQIEDISVYQMMLGAFQLLRRIDSDFVNLSPIVAYSGAPLPVLSTIANATVITKGSPEVSGTWVPLAAAQAYVKDHLHPGTTALDVFLSDTLVERFPTALQAFRRSNADLRVINQFGRHFNSTLLAAQLEVQTDGWTGSSWDSRHGWIQKEGDNSSASSGAAPFALGAALSASERQHTEEADGPLSKTEQELFHELCFIPDWAEELTGAEMVVDPPVGASQPAGDGFHGLTIDTTPIQQPIVVLEPAQSRISGAALMSPISPTFAEHDRSDRPLRRSKRVADALAATSRTRSRKGNSRNSLS